MMIYMYIHAYAYNRGQSVVSVYAAVLIVQILCDDVTKGQNLQCSGFMDLATGQLSTTFCSLWADSDKRLPDN